MDLVTAQLELQLTDQVLNEFGKNGKVKGGISISKEQVLSNSCMDS